MMIQRVDNRNGIAPNISQVIHKTVDGTSAVAQEVINGIKKVGSATLQCEKGVKIAGYLVLTLTTFPVLLITNIFLFSPLRRVGVAPN